MKQFKEYIVEKLTHADEDGNIRSAFSVVCDAQRMMGLLYEAILQSLDIDGNMDEIKIDLDVLTITQILEVEDHRHGQEIIFEAITDWHNNKHKFRYWYADYPGCWEEPPDFDAELTVVE
jgi:hypothetical protein